MGALHSIYHLYRLNRRLFWPEDRLETLRRWKLFRLLEYCYQQIPYYQEQFKRIGAQPGDFRRPEDLVNFPVLEKETLRDRAEEFLDPEADRRALIRHRSAGSTGIPLELLYHPSERLRMGFTVTRELLHSGLKPWYRQVNITEPRHSAPKNRWYHRLGLMNEQFLSVYDQSDLNLVRLKEIRPHLLIGFPSVLMVIGQEMILNVSRPLRPKLLFTLAEVLTSEDRRVLAEQWGVEPIDLYGANEVGHIAFQCPLRREYHLNLDSLQVEIIVGDRPAKVGERGEVVVTNFDLRVMPIIRYRVGDIAQRIEGRCPCGCLLPLLGRIAGRSDGFIIAADGKSYSALEVSLLLKPVEGIKQYRLIQEEKGRVQVEWVAAGSDSNPQDEIRKTLQERLGEETSIEIRRLAQIPREKSGKIRTVISSLPHPFWRQPGMAEKNSS